MRKNYTYPFVFLALAAVAPLHLQAAAEGEAETEVELVDAELAAARGSLPGVVLDDARHAVPGAVVYIRSLNLGVVSGTDGSFSLRGIPEITTKAPCKAALIHERYVHIHVRIEIQIS